MDERSFYRLCFQTDTHRVLKNHGYVLEADKPCLADATVIRKQNFGLKLIQKPPTPGVDGYSALIDK
ncbi:MAG: hypothetical protein R6U50_04230 [Desulfobacterales bacterium]